LLSGSGVLITLKLVEEDKHMQLKFSRTFAMSAGVAVMIIALALAACGKSNGGGGSKTITIGSDLPTTGADGGDGLPTQNGAQLAVNQNTNLGNGYTLKFEPKNDVSTTSGKHDPQTGAQNITALASDPTVMGVVGPFNSSVAVAEIPISSQQNLALISPANTNPGLTLQQYAAANGIIFSQLYPNGQPACYFRIPGNDVVQGTLDADIALTPVPAKNKPAFTKVYVVDDNETYGVGLANFFMAEFTNPQNPALAGKGGKVVGHDSITQNDASALKSLASKILAAKPDFVFYGGVTSNGGATLKADLGPNVIMEGGDGIADDPSWLTSAGAAAANTFGTVAAPDTSTFTTGPAATFVSDYTAAFGSPPIPYSASAYDAASIEIQAIKGIISAGQTPTRQAVCHAIQKISYTGVTGTISFDSHGDNAGQKVFSVYEVVNGKWVFQQEVPVSG
jgi:branched-chain amino acid transport system substrate-binding protein